jgi:glycosyltransferase involved in cell wall biosynthesis
VIRNKWQAWLTRRRRKIMSTYERLRVLHITPSFGVGGAEQMAGHLMVGLSESHDVAGAGLYPAMNSSIEHRLMRANIPLWHLGKRPGFDPRLFWSLDRVFEKVRPHVVHTHLSVLRYALPGLLRRRVPVVVHTLHNLAEHETDAFGRLVQWFAFRHAVLPVAISREVAASVKRVYGVECKAMVPNCIPVDNYRRNLADRVRWREKERFERDAILFTCVGRLEPQKNPLLLVEAFAALNDPRTHLVMLGEGSLREQVAAYIQQHELGRRVHLLGKRSEVAECLAASDVFVLSSNWEGNPLAVMEAMAAGLPVIGTAVGGVPELVESGRQGILVPPGDCLAFANAMRTLLNDPHKRASMANAARALATAAFKVERMAQGYASVYQAALAGSSRATSAAA